MTIPFPANYEKRKVTFNSNYAGGGKNCYYLSNYWTNGDVSFDAPARENCVFRGWFTEKDGGTEVKNYKDILADDAVLYAQWWGKWKITKEPTTEDEGCKWYNSKYGMVKVTFPKKEKECTIELINGKYWFGFLKSGTYYAEFEIGGQVETVEKVNNYGEVKMKIEVP